MTIRIKLLLSFLVIILLTIILGFVSYRTIHSISNELIPVIKANDKISTHMLALRNNEKDFLTRSIKDPDFYKTGKSKYLANFESEYIKLKKETNRVKEFSDSEHTDIVMRIEGLLNIYRTEFMQVVNAKKDRGFKDWGRIGELRDAVHEIEDTLLKVGGEKDLLVNMLMNRRHEKDYLLRNDPKYQVKLGKRVAEFHQLLGKSFLGESDKANLSKLIDNYRTKFDSVVQIDEKIGRSDEKGLTGKYYATIHKLEPLLLKQERLFNQAVSDEVNKSIMWILATILLTIVLGLVLVGYLSSVIATPLKEMAEAGKKIASGELDAKMPSINTKDEVKEMHMTMSSLIGALRYHMSK